MNNLDKFGIGNTARWVEEATVSLRITFGLVYGVVWVLIYNIAS